MIFLRCLSAPSCDPNFGEENPIVPRTVEHTQEAVESFELGTLWEEYGLVGNIVVSHI